MKDNFVRISSIISLIKDFSMIPSHILEAKQIVGTNVHNAIEEFYKGGIVPKLTEKENDYFKSFLKYDQIASHVPEVLEKRFYDKEKFLTGKVDMIGRRDNKLYIVDYKTTAQPDEKCWKIQGGFYYNLVRQSYDIEPYFIILHLTRKRSFRIFELKLDEEVFLECESLYNLYFMLNPR